MEIVSIARTGRDGGQLFTSTLSRPTFRCGSVQEDLTQIKNKDVQVIVCLLEWSELINLGLEKYPEQAQQAGILFYHFPFNKREVPKAKNIFGVTSLITSHLAKGENILVQCEKGSDRSSLICGCCLIHYNYSSASAICELRRRKSNAFNKTCYVEALENYCNLIVKLKTRCPR